MEIQNGSLTEQLVESLKSEKLSGGLQSDGAKNFALPHELTVTITLDEYRRLIANDVEQKANDGLKYTIEYLENTAKWKEGYYDKEIESLRDEIKRLKATSGKETEK